MKAVVAAFNQEKILVGAFSVITNLRMDLFEGRPPQPGDKNLGNLRRKFCKEQWQEVAGGVGIQQRCQCCAMPSSHLFSVLLSSDTQEGYTQEKKWRDSPPPRTMCRVAVLCSRQQPPTINLGESIYQLLTLWMLKLAACPDKTNFARTEQSEMKWKVELIAKVLGWYQTRYVTLLYEALNISHAKNNWVQFRLCHLSRIEIHIVLFAVKIA